MLLHIYYNQLLDIKLRAVSPCGSLVYLDIASLCQRNFSYTRTLAVIYLDINTNNCNKTDI